MHILKTKEIEVNAIICGIAIAIVWGRWSSGKTQDRGVPGSNPARTIGFF